MPDSDGHSHLQDHDAVMHWLLAVCIVAERALCKNHHFVFVDLRTQAIRLRLVVGSPAVHDVGDASGRLWEVSFCALLQYAAKHPNPNLYLGLAQHTHLQH